MQDRFNNTEITHPLNITGDQGIANLGEFYIRVLDSIGGVAQRVFSQVGRQDLVQLEFRGDTLPQGVSIILTQDEFDLNQFQFFLDRIVQSNTAVTADGNLQLIVQVIKNPRGGGRKKNLG